MAMDEEATETFRRRLIDRLKKDELGFEELRRELDAPARALEDDLRHVERSLKHCSERLRIEPSRCLGCGFTFNGRAGRHLHAPRRCPRCRSERISDPRFRIE
jgi:transcriptional regulator